MVFGELASPPFMGGLVTEPALLRDIKQRKAALTAAGAGGDMQGLRVCAVQHHDSSLTEIAAKPQVVFRGWKFSAF